MCRTAFAGRRRWECVRSGSTCVAREVAMPSAPGLRDYVKAADLGLSERVPLVGSVGPNASFDDAGPSQVGDVCERFGEGEVVLV
jgi:hypothetical protein